MGEAGKELEQVAVLYQPLLLQFCRHIPQGLPFRDGHRGGDRFLVQRQHIPCPAPADGSQDEGDEQDAAHIDDTLGDVGGQAAALLFFPLGGGCRVVGVRLLRRSASRRSLRLRRRSFHRFFLPLLPVVGVDVVQDLVDHGVHVDLLPSGIRFVIFKLIVIVQPVALLALEQLRLFVPAMFFVSHVFSPHAVLCDGENAA